MGAKRGGCQRSCIIDTLSGLRKRKAAQARRFNRRFSHTDEKVVDEELPAHVHVDHPRRRHEVRSCTIHGRQTSGVHAGESGYSAAAQWRWKRLRTCGGWMRSRVSWRLERGFLLHYQEQRSCSFRIAARAGRCRLRGRSRCTGARHCTAPGGGSEGAAAATQSHEAPTATSPTSTAAGMQRGRFAAWGAMIELGGRSNSKRQVSAYTYQA